MSTLTYEDKVRSMADDIAVFSDIGTDVPNLEVIKENYVIRFKRNGEDTEILVPKDGSSLLERSSDQEYKHASFRALLASERYGALRSWAAKQRTYLQQQAAGSKLIPIHGIIDGGIQQMDSAAVNTLLASPQHEGSTRVLLIDGPAGIGKTRLVLSLALDRATNYATERRPLILPVQSRGRTLSYIYDLMAFSLQRLRIDVTFDQVPVLAKHGLVTIAIDGFDELADPDGYDFAWAQVSELIKSLRGSGSIILAGRETFIGRDRAMKDISSLREGVDDVTVLTIQPPTPRQALDWLQEKGWVADQLSSIQHFLEPSSLALRPFFLEKLSDPSVATQITQTSYSDILSILVNAMIEREVTKFGEAVERELSLSNRLAYVRNLMNEVARDMAENSTTSVSDAALSWLVEVALPIEVSEETVRLLKSRSNVLAFLTNDTRPGYRTFFHDKFYEYFLSLVVIETLSRGEVSKAISRNIVGSSFLETFGALICGNMPSSTSREFLNGALGALSKNIDIDRTRGNVTALLVACLPIADLVDNFSLSSAELDEARAFGTAAPVSLDGLVISQLDCRGADLSSVLTENCTILTMIADAETVVPAGFPRPYRVQDLASANLIEPAQIELWIKSHSIETSPLEENLIPLRFINHDAIKLLKRACRLKQYWLRRADDVYATRILDNPHWPTIERCLDVNNLLRVEYRQASGTDARFLHIRQSDDLLLQTESNGDVLSFYKCFIAALELP